MSVAVHCGTGPALAEPMDHAGSEPPPKRRRTSPGSGNGHEEHSKAGGSRLLDAPISPPRNRAPGNESHAAPAAATAPSAVIPSPVQLTTVNGLGEADNFETASLRDLIGDPLIKECWVFNYLFDVDYVLENLDEDVRDQVQLKVVHGSWKKENANRIHIEEAASRHKNVEPIVAYIPDPFGTHHSKMIIIAKRDDTAQVVILTANMIRRDWRMCQAVWRSPILPLSASPSDGRDSPEFGRMGSGARFKFDLLAYLRSYGSKLTGLMNSLRCFDFSAVKGCLIASTPGHHSTQGGSSTSQTLWGWPALRSALNKVPVSGKGHIVAQISSVATLGVTDSWLNETLLKSLGSSATEDARSHEGRGRPRVSIVFPTPEDIRRTIDGYACGASIHMKIQTPAQRKQLDYLRPHLCHWGGTPSQRGSSIASAFTRTPSSPSGRSEAAERRAGRNRAGPHIKTYLRFADSDMNRLDWALVTSANMSKQAWGMAADEGRTKVCSYEIGVLVWPGLWDEEKEKAVLVPVFKKDTPDIIRNNESKSPSTKMNREGIHVGFRMPYDLPLVPYAEQEEPWSPAAQHLTPDSRGGVWLTGKKH